MPRNKLSIFPREEHDSDNLQANADVSSTVASLNRLVHEPARLAILTVLASCDSADFVFLRTATGLTVGNLSIQLSRLEQAALIEMERTIEKRRTLTMVRLTGNGRGELQQYWRDMDRLRQQIREAVPNKERPHMPAGRPLPALRSLPEIS